MWTRSGRCLALALYVLLFVLFYVVFSPAWGGGPVDQNVFHRLPIGYAAAYILRDLGEPDERLVLRTEFRQVRPGLLREVVIEGWVYRGEPSGAMRRLLILEGGVLTGKQSVREP